MVRFGYATKRHLPQTQAASYLSFMETFIPTLALIALAGFPLLFALAVAAWRHRRRRSMDEPTGPIALTRRWPRGPGGTAPVGPAQETFVVMPDITGYTRFLHRNHFAEVHAQHLVSELLQAVMAAAPPALTVAKVEGDAVLLFAPVEGRGGRSVDEVEQALLRLFRAFYQRRRALIRSNLCPCAACRHINELELKAVVHRGPVTSYRLGDFVELSGIAVVVVHRLLKNSVNYPRYVLVTDAAGAMIPSFTASGERVRESDRDIGVIDCHVYPFDLPDVSEGMDAVPPSRRVFRDMAAKLTSHIRSRRSVSRPAPPEPPQASDC
ncbi:hypothetical protein CKO28_17010 [Rhodovibrio sodomensis]|uniref:Guanylate cyclase domain-containing protein n=1 Tax=Rhodovibrio sodomensis TaxID=1088 RepID=A0ABS1DIY0_9PROT|nr:hypothetical protein [Rhodovibrio sodomensis]